MFKTPDGSEVKLQLASSTPQGPLSNKLYATLLSPSITEQVSADDDNALVSTEYDELFAWLLQNKVDDQQIGHYLLLREISLSELQLIEFENGELQDLVQDIEKESKSKIQMIDKNRFIRACKKLRPLSNCIHPQAQPQYAPNYQPQPHRPYPPPPPHRQHPHSVSYAATQCNTAYNNNAYYTPPHSLPFNPPQPPQIYYNNVSQPQPPYIVHQAANNNTANKEFAQQKIENKGHEPETLGYVPPDSNVHLLPPAITPNDGCNYPTDGFESDDLLSEGDEYINMDEYGQEEDPLYSKPNGNTTNGAQSGNIMHFCYMDVVPDGEEDDYNDELYHEKQRWEMCLMHALNGLLQKRQFTVKRMNAICKELAPQKVINPHKSLLQTGNYDANVLMMALGKMNIEVQWFDSRKKHEFDLCEEAFLQFLEPAKHTFVGFILNKPSKTAFMIKRRHWMAVKKINGEWYNLDSKLKQPQKYKNAQELNAYLVHSLGENGAELMICRKKKIENVQQKTVQMNAVLQW